MIGTLFGSQADTPRTLYNLREAAAVRECSEGCLVVGSCHPLQRLLSGRKLSPFATATAALVTACSSSGPRFLGPHVRSDAARSESEIDP